MNPNELRTRFRNMLSVKQREWYRVENQAAGPTQIHIYDDIGLSGVTARDLVDDLNKIKGPVELRLNSGGGEIFDGISIFNALSARDVSVYIDGVAASAASFIAMAASPGKLFIAKTASMMIHDGQAMAMGSAQDLTAMVDVLNRESQKIAGIYADRTGKDVEYFRDKMRSETWYNAAEALEEGLADAIFDPRTGSVVTNSVKDEKTVVTEAEKIASEAVTMKTDNVVTNADVDESAWDAAKAWSAGSASDNPEAFYRAICAGEKTDGNPATQAHWALPYRYTPTSPPNAAGVRNAMARLSQTQGLKNESEARSKLEGLMKKVNPDYTPSDRIDPALLANALRDALIGGK